MVADLGWTEDMSPLFASPPPTPVRISRQNEVLSGPLHPHNVIIKSCLIYFKLCGATLHFGVPEWLQELACMRCTKEAEQQPLCIFTPLVFFYASAETRAGCICTRFNCVDVQCLFPIRKRKLIHHVLYDIMKDIVTLKPAVL